jgi:hypothetical protein
MVVNASTENIVMGETHGTVPNLPPDCDLERQKPSNVQLQGLNP